MASWQQLLVAFFLCLSIAYARISDSVEPLERASEEFLVPMKRFYTWEYSKRDQRDLTTPEKRSFTPEMEPKEMEEKRKQFYAWAGKRSGMEKRKQFYAWAGRK